MANKSRFLTMSLASFTTPKQNLVGMSVVADYAHPVTKLRTIVFERIVVPSATADAPKPKAAAPKPKPVVKPAPAPAPAPEAAPAPAPTQEAS